MGAFQRHFTAGREGLGVGGRHFGVFGYGIADFVWMDRGQRGNHSDGASREPMLTAFEMKLKNWKTGLSHFLFVAPRLRSPLVRLAALCNTRRGLANSLSRRLPMQYVPRISLEDVSKHLGGSQDSVHLWDRDCGRCRPTIGPLWKSTVSVVDKWARGGKSAR